MLKTASHEASMIYAIAIAAALSSDGFRRKTAENITNERCKRTNFRKRPFFAYLVCWFHTSIQGTDDRHETLDVDLKITPIDE
ncbi:hypothetical protein [Cesiribacter sp. SM1]|uniref:hypothetical protein n=1 Tax=Cesiribacter sp. SM1 TaxID=2861196 RepID=UPI001CD22561|nr:hypothetical protein [Cesiribacter sp. SM1]